MNKHIKKIITISTISLIITSCGRYDRCPTTLSKSIETLSESLNTLNSVPEQLIINGKTIESTYDITSVYDVRAIPEIFKDNCETKFTVKLLDSKTKQGLFNEYTLEYFWFYSEKTKRASENNEYENYSNDYTTIRILTTPMLETLETTLILKIKDKNNKSYLLKSINSNKGS